jgi:nicotinamidase/pyrazinamidase
MRSHDVIFWEVDAQRDFMLPGGNLYVPGAEKLLPNIHRLTDAARENKVFLVSHGCFHTRNDPEFKIFPPHCVEGTPGAELVPEALTERVLRVANTGEAKLPAQFEEYQQILLEKQTLNIFETCHAAQLVERLGTNPEFVVFGVTTEYCVRLAAQGLLERGRRVSVVEDAVEALKPAEGVRALSELRALGARIVTTDQAMAKLGHSASPRDPFR